VVRREELDLLVILYSHILLHNLTIDHIHYLQLAQRRW
jgi:hypothetical protein